MDQHAAEGAPSHGSFLAGPPVGLPRFGTLVEALLFRRRFNRRETVLIDHQTIAGRDRVIFSELDRVTFSQLANRAISYSVALSQRRLGGRTCAVLTRKPIEFASMYFGIWLAGGVAVAVPPLHRATREEDGARVASLLNRSEAASVLLTIDQLSLLRKSHLPDVETIVTRDVSPSRELVAPLPSPEDIACLQFTSGTTRHPLPVALSHRNLAYSCEQASIAYRLSGRDRSVTWVAWHHSMGLHVGLLWPIWNGYLSVVDSPLAFLQRPLRWLEAVGRCGATVSSAPTFGYAMCSSVGRKLASDIDLSCWRVARVAAERIQPAVLGKFVDTFARHGFKAHAICPSYGLSEATLGVATRQLSANELQREVSNSDMRAPTSRPDASGKVASSGRPLPGVCLYIRRRDGQVADTGEVGDIVVEGPNVASGYWQGGRVRADANLYPRGGCGVVRTGDIGYIDSSTLYVLGRGNNWITKHGCKYLVEDIECCLAESCQRLGLKGAVPVAFSHQGRFVLVFGEEGKHLDVAALRGLVGSLNPEFRLRPDVVATMPRAAIPRTPSGKIDRSALVASYASNTLPLEVAGREPTSAGDGNMLPWSANR